MKANELINVEGKKREVIQIGGAILNSLEIFSLSIPFPTSFPSLVLIESQV
jgi:hypothetical protein